MDSESLVREVSSSVLWVRLARLSNAVCMKNPAYEKCAEVDEASSSMETKSLEFSEDKLIKGTRWSQTRDSGSVPANSVTQAGVVRERQLHGLAQWLCRLPCTRMAAKTYVKTGHIVFYVKPPTEDDDNDDVSDEGADQ